MLSLPNSFAKWISTLEGSETHRTHAPWAVKTQVLWEYGSTGKLKGGDFSFKLSRGHQMPLTHKPDRSLTPSQKQRTWPTELLRPPGISQRCVCHSLRHWMTEVSCNKSTIADTHKISLPALIKWERSRAIPPLSSPLGLAQFFYMATHRALSDFLEATIWFSRIRESQRSQRATFNWAVSSATNMKLMVLHHNHKFIHNPMHQQITLCSDTAMVSWFARSARFPGILINQINTITSNHVPAVGHFRLASGWSKAAKWKPDSISVSPAA